MPDIALSTWSDGRRWRVTVPSPPTRSTCSSAVAGWPGLCAAASAAEARRATAGHREGRRARRVDADVRRHDLDGAEHGGHGDLGPGRRPEPAAAAGRRLAPGLAWLESLGVRPTAPIDSDRQVGAEVDVRPAHRTPRRGDRSRGWAGPDGDRARVDRDRRRRHRRRDGHRGRRGRRSFRARSVVLATGGFGGSQELLERYMGPYVGAMLLRANPRNTGDGLRAALGAGARTSPSMWTFYGHTMPGLPADPPPAQWVSVTQYYTQDAILVNARGPSGSSTRAARWRTRPPRSRSSASPVAWPGS